MSDYTPPFKATDEIINLVGDITEQITRISVLSHGNLAPHLRKENRIRTIHSSLAIEQNSLSLEQVTAIINGKRVLGNPFEIREVENAIKTYEMLLQLSPYSVKDLLKAHKQMMDGIITESGKFRSGGVGVFAGTTLVHMAPPAQFVSDQIDALFEWYKNSKQHPLVKSAIFHYEFEFIHPFADGNGRMGRLWHSFLLSVWREIFFWIPVEDLIRERQQEYYNALGQATKNGESSVFVTYMLEVMLDTLKRTESVGGNGTLISKHIQKLLGAMGNETLFASEIMERLGLTHRPAFRKNYLIPALNAGAIEMTIPDKPNSRNQQYRRK